MVMLKEKPTPEPKNVKIVRRKNLYITEDDDHRSIWKIAYADFMTAMMTFFLVMWLINITSKERIINLANYFNPVKLADPSPFRPGVREPKRGGTANDNVAMARPGKLAGERGGMHGSQAQPEPEEETLFRNPFPMLSQLALQAETAIVAATHPDKLSGTGTSHDPFITEYIIGPLVEWLTAAWRHETGSDTRATAPPASKPETAEASSTSAAAPPSQEAEAIAAQERKQVPAKTELSAAEQRRRQEIQKSAAQIEKDLAKLVETLPQSSRPGIEVKGVADGILISLTDDTNFNMFKISSAVPSPELVYFLERMGRIMNQYSGKLIVRGHTDRRPFAGDRHGNWRLSVNRATMTYYMLLRGKIDETRFLSLEGYAERDLRNKADPLAGENRRIEILIQVPEGQ